MVRVHRLRTALSAIAGGLVLGAALVSALGLAWAMPEDHGGPVARPAPPGQLAPAATGPSMPAPVPLALRAEEVANWLTRTTGGVGAHQDDPWAVIDACVREDMAGNPSTTADDTPAASIAVALGGTIAYTKGYGVRDPGVGGEVDAQTLFRIGSTTKMMTAAAVMNLVEAGKLDLQAPLSSYLSEYRLGHPWDSGDLTLDLLVSHQTGLIDQYFVQDPTIRLADWVRATGAMSLPLYAAPGTYWNYANPNFSLAGAVVERVTGTPYADYMSGSIWDSSGMPLTTISPTEVISSGNYTIGWHNGQKVPPGSFDFPMLAPAGNAYSTPTELVTWALVMQSDGAAVLEPASRRAMQARRTPTGYLPWMDYGYGIFVTDWRDAEKPDQRVVVYDHGGNINGGSSQLYWIPERGVVVSILASTIRSLDRAAACAVSTLAGIEPIPTGGLKTEPETWDAFTGTYSLVDVFRWPWTAAVSRVSDTLAMSFPDIAGSAMLEGPTMPFFYAYADLFVPIANSMLAGPNAVDMTFIRDREDPSRVRFMRNRNLVGQRVGRFPERVELSGTACTPVRFTSELDMPVLRVQASGLVTATQPMSVALAADDPADPETASIRRGFHVGPGGTSMVYAITKTAPDDAVGLFLLGDRNGDGQFSLADELVASGFNDMGTSMVYAPTPLPEGDYQLWVWGMVVNGASSWVHLDLQVMQGDQLRLENVPRGLADGASWEMRVCAERVKALTAPATGMIAFSYDSPPRLFRVMVDWFPAEVPRAIYLPYARQPAH